MNNTEKLVQRWLSLVKFYSNFKTIESVICIEKGGIPLERYIGRYFGADVLEYLLKLGMYLIKVENIDAEFAKYIKGNFSLKSELQKLQKEFKPIADLVSVSEKPIQKMTLEEFAKSFKVELED